jgi:hypothetical protein
VRYRILRNLREYYYKVARKWGLLRSHQNGREIKASTLHSTLRSPAEIDLQNQLSEAIRLKCKVELNYKGEGCRLVCPHAIYNSASGKMLLDSYQIAGHSNHSMSLPYWRPFDVSKIEGLKIVDENFSTAPGYDPLSNRYSNPIVKI